MHSVPHVAAYSTWLQIINLPAQYERLCSTLELGGSSTTSRDHTTRIPSRKLGLCRHCGHRMHLKAIGAVRFPSISRVRITHATGIINDKDCKDLGISPCMFRAASVCASQDKDG